VVPVAVHLDDSTLDVGFDCVQFAGGRRFAVVSSFLRRLNNRNEWRPALSGAHVGPSKARLQSEQHEQSARGAER